MSATAQAHPVPRSARIVKHALFRLLPGRVGLRNRACFHHMTKQPIAARLTRALSDIRPGDICIDCGANRGEYTMQFAECGAQVHAFEPDPWSFAQLREHIGSDTPNVHLINAAVDTQSGHLDFYRDADFDAGPVRASLASSIYPRPDRAQETIRVETLNFLDFLRGLDGDIRILKIDIEGAEIPLLEALFASELMARIDYLFVETHELQFPDLLERTWALRAQARTITSTHVDLDWH